jgi:hypothetical protein
MRIRLGRAARLAAAVVTGGVLTAAAGSGHRYLGAPRGVIAVAGV